MAAYREELIVSKVRKNTLKTGKYLEAIYPRVALIILGIVLVLILTINTQDIVDGNDAYRMHASLASLIAGISALYSLVGVFVLKSRKSKVLLGIGVLLSAGLSFYSFYIASFTITW